MIPNQRVARVEKILENDGFNSAAWTSLFQEAQKLSIAESRPYYEKFVKKFPSSALHWRGYLDHELQNRNFAQVEALFSRCLVDCVNVPLYQAYLKYIKEIKDPKSESYQTEMIAIYDFVLKKVGGDYYSSEVWKSYIQFLKTSTAQTSYDESNKIMDVRRAYQKAVKSPRQNISDLWEEYSGWEKSINTTIAKKVLDDCAKSYTTARKASWVFEKHFQPISKTLLSYPPRGDLRHDQQLKCWEKYLEWEKLNPMNYDGKDGLVLLIKRVQFAYRQALLHLRYHEKVWIDAATYLMTQGHEAQKRGDTSFATQLFENSGGFYEDACKFLPHSLLLGFAYADHHESRGNGAEAKEVYERLLKLEGIDKTLVYINFMKCCKRLDSSTGLRKVFGRARNDDNCGHQAFSACALIELGVGGSKGDKVCGNLFEFGLKKFSTNVDYCLTYLNYITQKSEQNNARALFERVINALPAEDAIEVWNLFHSYEALHGDSATVAAIEQRRAKAYPALYEKFQAKHVVDRHKYDDLMPTSSEALKTFGITEEKGKGKHPALPVTVAAEQPSSTTAEVKITRDFFMPDLRQLGPFRPSPGSPAGVVYPSSVLKFLMMLPSPANFSTNLPRKVDVAKLMDLIAKTELSGMDLDQAPTMTMTGNKFTAAGKPKQPRGMGANNNSNNNKANKGGHNKRKHAAIDGKSKAINNNINTAASGPPPVQDVYRQRQRAKAASGNN